MNLFQQENALKGYSDENLSREMQSPSGSVPQYMVMSELSRRKKMRQEAAASPDDGGSVADEMRASMTRTATPAGPQGQPIGEPGPQTVPGQRQFGIGGLVQSINPIPMGRQSIKDIGDPKATFSHMAGNLRDTAMAPIDAVGFAEGGIVDGSMPEMSGLDRLMMMLTGNSPEPRTVSDEDAHLYEVYGKEPAVESEESAFERLKREQGPVGYADGGLAARQTQPDWVPLDENNMPYARRQPRAMTARQAGGIEGIADEFTQRLDANMMPPAVPVDTSRATDPNAMRSAPSPIYGGGNTSTDFSSVLGRDSNVSDPPVGRGIGALPAEVSRSNRADQSPSFSAVRSPLDGEPSGPTGPLGPSGPGLTGRALDSVGNYEPSPFEEGLAAGVTGPFADAYDGLKGWGSAFMEGLRGSDQIDPVAVDPRGDQIMPTPGTSVVEPDPAGPDASNIMPVQPGGHTSTLKPSEAVPSGSTVGVAAQGATASEVEEFESLRKMLGHDPEASQALIDGFEEKMQARMGGIDKDYADAKWMAVAQLGATMAAGQSPYFAANFGTGANAGIEALRGAKANKQKREMDFLGIEGDLVAARIAAKSDDVNTSAQLYGIVVDKTLAREKMANDIKAAGIRASGSGGGNDMLEFYYDTLNDQLKSIDKQIAGNPMLGIAPASGEEKAVALQERDRVLSRIDEVRRSVIGDAGRVGGAASPAAAVNPFKAALAGGG